MFHLPSILGTCYSSVFLHGGTMPGSKEYQAQWRRDNRAKLLQDRKDWYERNKDRVRARNSLTPRRSLYIALSHGLKRRPCDNPATIDQVMALWDKQKGRCALTGLKMRWSKGDQNYMTAPRAVSIDRIDVDGSYTIDNIRLICHAINSFRGRMSDKEMRAMARALLAY